MAPAKIMYGLLLTRGGEVKKTKLAGATDRITLQIIQNILKRKETPLCLGTYEFEKYILHLFGYSLGKAGTENKHELPPPLDAALYFGDILIIASHKENTWATPVTFTSDQYEAFYNKQYGGFEDIGSEDSEDSEESEEIEEEYVGVEEEVKNEAEVKESTKKKDKEEGIEEEEEEEEEEVEEEEDEEEEGGEEDGEEEGEDEEEAPIIKKAATKKKPVKASISHGHNTGRAKQQHLIEANKIYPIEYEFGKERSIPKEPCVESEIRRHIIKLIHSKLPNVKSQTDVEAVIFESAYRDAKKKNICVHFDNPLFLIIYKSAARRLIANLCETSYVGNIQLSQKFQRGDVTLEHLRSMNIMEYAPHLYNELSERQVLREQNQLEGNKAMATDMFKCGRCYKRETTYYELQTRSADEPMTKFITCLNCGNHWRQ